jgi:hypothetical protein
MHDPIINCYTSYGSLFSIVDDKIWPWVFNNFIQIKYAHNWHILIFDNHHFILNTCPGIDYYEIPQNILINKWEKSLRHFIIDSIDAGYYLFMYSDRYYISKSDSFMKNHINHEIFVFGYDLEKDLVFIADNLSYGKFIRTECTFDELEKGYWSMGREFTFQTNIRFIKPQVEVVCKFDLEQVINGLNSYLYSKRSYNSVYDQKYSFGLDSMNIILMNLNDIYKKQAHVDVRPFHLFYEHKLLMEKRVHYMIENGYLTNSSELLSDFILLKNEYMILRNKVLKYNIKNDSNMLQEIIKRLDENIKTEKSLVNKLIFKLT